MDEAGALPTEGKFNSEEDFQQYWDFLPINPPPVETDDDCNGAIFHWFSLVFHRFSLCFTVVFTVVFTHFHCFAL